VRSQDEDLKDVRVGVKGRVDVGVPQQRLDELGVHPLREQEARTSVAEVVKTIGYDPNLDPNLTPTQNRYSHVKLVLLTIRLGARRRA